jgi:hypothetical protein
MPLNLQSLSGGAGAPADAPPDVAPAAAEPEPEKEPKPRTRTARPRTQKSEVFVATQSGSAQGKKGDSYVFIKGVTRVRAGHELLKLVPDYFEPADDHVHYDEVTR